MWLTTKAEAAFQTLSFGKLFRSNWDDFPSERHFVAVDLFANGDSIVYKQHYYTIYDFLAKVGGLFFALRTFVAWFLQGIAAFRLKAIIAGKAYTWRPKWTEKSCCCSVRNRDKKPSPIIIRAPECLYVWTTCVMCCKCVRNKSH
jgi:hypothetical protein